MIGGRVCKLIKLNLKGIGSVTSDLRLYVDPYRMQRD